MQMTEWARSLNETPRGKFAAGEKVAWKQPRAGRTVGVVKRLWTRLEDSHHSYDVIVANEVLPNVPEEDLMPYKPSWDQEVI